MMKKKKKNRDGRAGRKVTEILCVCPGSLQSSNANLQHRDLTSSHLKSPISFSRRERSPLSV